MRTETPVMPGTLLLRLCSEQARTLFDWLYDVPTESRFEPGWLAEMIQAFAAHAELLSRADRALWLQAAGGNVLNYVDADYLMAGLIESALTQCRHLKDALGRLVQGGPLPNGRENAGAKAPTPERAGVQVMGAEELDRTVALLEQLLKVHRDSWPKANPPTWAEAEEAFRRGEYLDLEEAFAQVAGTSPEGWQQRVEAHKRKQEAGGGQ
jgi:hypothetical protein